MAARIDVPDLVQREYADERNFATRFKVFREYYEGPSLEEAILGILLEALPPLPEGQPARVLEVGSGEGHFAALMAAHPELSVQAVDLSPRMVEVARQRVGDAAGVRVADVQQLPFPDDSFDAVVANWMLYHVPDLDRGLAEVARVLRPGGVLVATTLGPGTNAELWAMLPDDGTTPELSFTTSSGGAALDRHFASHERHDLRGTVRFPDHEAAKQYVAATITRGHLADQLPHFDGPLRTTSYNSVFVAHKRPA